MAVTLLTGKLLLLRIVPFRRTPRLDEFQQLIMIEHRSLRGWQTRRNVNRVIATLRRACAVAELAIVHGRHQDRRSQFGIVAERLANHV